MGYSGQALRGITWMGGLKFFIKAISFIKIFILARLLSPSDFGVYAIAALVISFLEVFTETGINIFFIQTKDKKVFEKYIDTAWAISIFRGILVALVIFAASPLIAGFFNSPEAEKLLKLSSAVPLIKGFINPSIVKFQKGLMFGKEFMLRSSVILIESVAAVAFAIITQSPVSFILALIFGAAFESLFSLFYIFPRPVLRFSTKKAGEILSKGKWVTLNGITNYLTMQGDDAVVGKMLSVKALGIYQIAYKLAILPGSEIGETVNRVILPTFANFADDKKRLQRAYTKAIIFTLVLSVPLGGLLFIYPSQVISITVGNQWLEAAPVLQVLAVFGVVSAVMGTRNAVFFAAGRQNIAARIGLIKLTALFVTIVPMVSYLGIVGAAYASLISVLAIIPPTFYYLNKVFNEE